MGNDEKIYSATGAREEANQCARSCEVQYQAMHWVDKYHCICR